MKGLKKVALATAISSISAGSFADMELLDEEGLQNITGQAGLTIDVESQWEIGEFAYRDAGFIVIEGLRMGGNSFGNGTGTAGSYLDNLRLDVDVAGAGPDNNTLHYGFSMVREHAQHYVDEGNLDPEFGQVASGIDVNRGNIAIDDKKIYDDGDLVIHFDFTDGWQSEGGFVEYEAAGRFTTDVWDDVELIFEHAVDFRFEIDAIGLAASDYEIGSRGLDGDGTGPDSGSPGTTTLISQLGIQGYLGPEDLHIENDGDGFGDDGSGIDFNGNGDLTDDDSGNADSKITWGTYFIVTDLDVYIDIAGIQINDMEIHNKRGDRTGLDGTSSFDFAHSIREIYAVNDAVLNVEEYDGTDLRTAYVNGIAINTRFKGDIDINSLSFGNDGGESIGQLYFTDIESDTRWIISAH